MNRREFDAYVEKLWHHDWFYDFSDDHRVRSAGASAQADLEKDHAKEFVKKQAYDIVCGVHFNERNHFPQCGPGYTKEEAHCPQQTAGVIGMKITRQSPLTGQTNTMDLDITQAQLDAWMRREGFIQDIMPNLTPGEREFLISGCTEEDWNKLFKGADA